MKKIKSFVKKYPYHTGAAALVLVVLAVFFLTRGGNEPEASQDALRTVETLSVSEYGEGALGVAYPTANGNSFVVRSQASGLVKTVVESGTKITAGSIIAELDNASERAALTQAQGSYEAALAGAAQSDVSVADAKTALTGAKQDAIAAEKAALTAWTNSLYNTVDELFVNPRVNPPGVRINTDGKATSLNSDRVNLGTTLSEWQNGMGNISPNSEVSEITRRIDLATSRMDQLLSMVDTFIGLIQKQAVNEVFTAAELSRLSAEFSATRSALNAQQSALASAKSSLLRADETVNSAAIGGTGGQISAANASIKQALGYYQAAKANYDRTIVRAPFAGTVTSQNIAVGDIINTGTDVAIIIPEAGVETTRWWTLPLSAVKYTPDKAYVFTVKSDNTLEAIEIETGLVTSNNIRVTGLSGDENIVKDVRGLKAGEKVELSAQ